MSQTVFQPQPNINPNNGGGNRAPLIHPMLLVALLLFSLAGLLSGFAVGAMTHTEPPSAGNSNPRLKQTPVAAQPTAPKQQTPTVDIMNVGLGCPLVSQFYAQEVADNTTPYTLHAQVVDKSINQQTPCGQGKPLQVSGITCKLWLTKDDHINQTLLGAMNRLKSVDTLQQPFPNEETNALNFTGSQQTQPCNPQGQTAWSYQVNTSVKPGKYYLVMLADWQGKLYNWSWKLVNITKAG